MGLRAGAGAWREGASGARGGFGNGARTLRVALQPQHGEGAAVVADRWATWGYVLGVRGMRWSVSHSSFPSPLRMFQTEVGVHPNLHFQGKSTEVKCGRGYLGNERSSKIRLSPSLYSVSNQSNAWKTFTASAYVPFCFGFPAINHLLLS